MHYVIGILIIAFANQSFTLLPWYHIKGSFNVVDLGNVLLWAALAGMLLQSRKIGDFRNPISLFVIGYLFFILVHVANVMVNYDQGLISTLIRSRHQYFYLAYFYFLLAFDTPEKMERFLDYLTIVAMGLIVLAVVNYFWPVIFHHELYGDGQSDRAGIKRAYVPGMDIIGMTLLWQLLKYLEGGKNAGGAAMKAGFLFLGLLFRQTRGRIIAASAVAGWMLLRARRLRLLAATALFVGVLGIAMEFLLPENILVNSYTSAVTDVADEEGTWRGRMAQIETSWNAFREHPLIGSGALLIRATEDAILTQEIVEEAYQSDLGWPHWLKNFGIAGMLWVIALAAVIFFKRRSVLKARPRTRIGEFAFYQWLHLLVGMATIGYFFRGHGIVIVSLTLAMLTRAYFLKSPAPAPSLEKQAVEAAPAAPRLLRRRRDVKRKVAPVA